MPPLHGGGRRFKSYRNYQLYRYKMQQLEFWPFPTNPELDLDADWNTFLEGFTTPHETVKETIAANHIRVVHLFDKFNPYGGCTVAYRPVKHDKTGYPTGKFAYVAVAYCNPQDRYDRKVGQMLAVEMLMDGDCILMPLYVNGEPVRALRAIFDDILAQPFRW